MGKDCPCCFMGKIVNPEKEDEVDRLYDGGQFSYYEAMLNVRDGYLKCPECNGTGKIQD